MKEKRQRKILCPFSVTFLAFFQIIVNHRIDQGIDGIAVLLGQCFETLVLFSFDPDTQLFLLFQILFLWGIICGC